jgi:hypothetical protein
MDDLPDALERLATRLEMLERRVAVLEHSSAAPSPALLPDAPVTPAAQVTEALPFSQSSSLFSVMGKAMLGIAGAYVLRAVAESSSLPKLAVAAVAIGYALMWLVWAARSKAEEKLANTVYSCTSAVILAPLLWELTLRFKVLDAAATAGVLSGFVIAAFGVAFRRKHAPVLWVANITAAVVALGLAIATHDLAPFLFALLLMVLCCEIAARCGLDLNQRPLVAAITDLGTWGLIFIYSGPPAARAGYPEVGAFKLIAPACLLFALYAASIVVKTLVQKRQISTFETGQTLVAFLLAACTLLYFAPTAGAPVLAALCLVLSAASYAAVFMFFAGEGQRRNYHVFASWSAALLPAGCLLCLAPPWFAVCMGVAAIAATVLGARLNRTTLQVHGLVYLTAAAIASGLPAYAFRALAGTLPAAPARTACLAAVCAIVCYGTAKPADAESAQRLLHLVPAAIAVCGLAALLVQGLLGLLTLLLVPDVYHVAFIRTLITCALALLLAYSGPRWGRMELNWIAWTTLVFVAAKLLFEDLRHGNLVFIAGSIFLFAVTLMAVPRLAHMGQRI